MTAKFHSKSIANLLGVGMVALAVPLSAQNGGRSVPPPLAPTGSSAAQPAAPAKGTAATPAPTVTPGVQLPPGYVIGPEDVLTVLYWKDKDMSTDVAVRPDGKISLPLLNDIDAAGLTPEQLRNRLTEESKRYLEDPNVTVVVKQINSRRVFVIGEIGKQGPYSLTAPITVLQLISLAGGLSEYADSKNIRIIRIENGKPVTIRFNYKDAVSGKNLTQNIELKPGDTIVVP